MHHSTPASQASTGPCVPRALCHRHSRRDGGDFEVAHDSPGLHTSAGGSAARRASRRPSTSGRPCGRPPGRSPASRWWSSRPGSVKAPAGPLLALAGNKSDGADAYMLADVLRTDGHRLRPLAPTRRHPGPPVGGTDEEGPGGSPGGPRPAAGGPPGAGLPRWDTGVRRHRQPHRPAASSGASRPRPRPTGSRRPAWRHGCRPTPTRAARTPAVSLSASTRPRTGPRGDDAELLGCRHPDARQCHRGHAGAHRTSSRPGSASA